jgi:DNA repair exonuclease SbcCD ATPase subunit
VGGDSSTLLNVASSVNKSLESVKAMIDRGASEEALSQLEAIERKINDYMSFVSKLVVVETKLSQFASYLEETKKSEPNISLDKFYNEVSRLNSEKRAVYEKWSAGDLSGANQTANSILNSIENLSNEAKSYVTEQKEMIKRMEEEKQRNIMIAVIAVVIVVIAVAGFLIYKRRKEKEEVSIVIKPPTG